MRRKRLVLGALAGAPALGLLLMCAPSGTEQRIPARAGAELQVDVTFGGGFSFDKGSLTVTSHDAAEVRIQVHRLG